MFLEKVNDLNVGKLKNVPVYLKKIIDVVDHEAVKNTKLNTLMTKVNNKKSSWCNCINESKQVNQNKISKTLRKKMEILIKKISD